MTARFNANTRSQQSCPASSFDFKWHTQSYSQPNYLRIRWITNNILLMMVNLKNINPHDFTAACFPLFAVGKQSFWYLCCVHAALCSGVLHWNTCSFHSEDIQVFAVWLQGIWAAVLPGKGTANIIIHLHWETIVFPLRIDILREPTESYIGIKNCSSSCTISELLVMIFFFFWGCIFHLWLF